MRFDYVFLNRPVLKNLPLSHSCGSRTFGQPSVEQSDIKGGVQSQKWVDQSSNLGWQFETALGYIKLKIKQQQITLRSWVYFLKTRKQTPPLPQTKNKGTGTSASLCRLVKSSWLTQEIAEQREGSKKQITNPGN